MEALGWVRNEKLWAQVQTATPLFFDVFVNLSQRNFSCTKENQYPNLF